MKIDLKPYILEKPLVVNNGLGRDSVGIYNNNEFRQYASDNSLTTREYLNGKNKELESINEEYLHVRSVNLDSESNGKTRSNSSKAKILSSLGNGSGKDQESDPPMGENGGKIAGKRREKKTIQVVAKPKLDKFETIKPRYLNPPKLRATDKNSSSATKIQKNVTNRAYPGRLDEYDLSGKNENQNLTVGQNPGPEYNPKVIKREKILKETSDINCNNNLGAIKELTPTSAQTAKLKPKPANENPRAGYSDKFN